MPALAEIARASDSQQTRLRAIEALGRIRTQEAQETLLSLVFDPNFTEDEPARRGVVPRLRPRSLDDPFAAKMAELLDHPAILDAEREQIAFTLGLVGLRDGTVLPDSVSRSLSPESRALLDVMKARALDPNHGDRR